MGGRRSARHRAPVPGAQHRRRRHPRVPVRHRRHVDLGQAGGAPAGRADCRAGGAQDDRQRHRDGAHLQCGAELVRRDEDRLAIHRAGQADAERLCRDLSFAGLLLNGRMRDELFNETLFLSLRHAREVISSWIDDHNTERPRSSLGYATPAAFTAGREKQGRDARSQPPVSGPGWMKVGGHVT